ncbi:hypothetical protein, partial [uncultured Prevotella sp.]|uniref:hypothetical protein n=1 Tax=uncultured Prevotella sp. TaxID=159272 RepID=UPI00259BEED0
GRYSYTTVLVVKVLNISGIQNDQNPVVLGNAVQWSQEVLILNFITSIREKLQKRLINDTFKLIIHNPWFYPIMLLYKTTISNLDNEYFFSVLLKLSICYY